MIVDVCSFHQTLSFLSQHWHAFLIARVVEDIILSVIEGVALLLILFTRSLPTCVSGNRRLANGCKVTFLSFNCLTVSFWYLHSHMYLPEEAGCVVLARVCVSSIGRLYRLDLSLALTLRFSSRCTAGPAPPPRPHTVTTSSRRRQRTRCPS